MLHRAGTPFNSVIRFRTYLTPGECGLPTRYTHPPPTPTPHMGEHCTAEVPACTHSFLTLKQPYCGSLQSLPSTQQSTVYPNPPVDSRHFTPQLSYVYAHLHFVFACCYVASYNLHSDGLTNLANTDTPGSELPRDVPRTAVCSSFPVALLFCRSPKALSLASLAGMRRARPRWPPFIIL